MALSSSSKDSQGVVVGGAVSSGERCKSGQQRVVACKCLCWLSCFGSHWLNEPHDHVVATVGYPQKRWVSNSGWQSYKLQESLHEKITSLGKKTCCKKEGKHGLCTSWPTLLLQKPDFIPVPTPRVGNFPRGYMRDWDCCGEHCPSSLYCGLDKDSYDPWAGLAHTEHGKRQNGQILL